MVKPICLIICLHHGEMHQKKTKPTRGASICKVNRILRRGPLTTDKIAYVPSMLLSGPAPGFGKLGSLLGKQVFKGVMDNVTHYKKRRQ